jgi:hypothetical protein
MSAPPREGLYLGDPEATPRPLAAGTATSAVNTLRAVRMEQMVQDTPGANLTVQRRVWQKKNPKRMLFRAC